MDSLHNSTKLSASRSLKTSIECLPNEILRQIFHDAYRTHGPSCPQRILLALLAVSRQWRETAKDTKELWTRVVIDGRLIAQELIDMFLQLSDPLPLDIFFSMTTPDILRTITASIIWEQRVDGMECLRKSAKAVNILQNLFRDCRRWRSAVIWLPYYLYWKLDFPANGAIEAPELKCLLLSSDAREEDNRAGNLISGFRDKSFLFNVSAPQIRVLKIASSAFSAFSRRGVEVTDLEVYGDKYGALHLAGLLEYASSSSLTLTTLRLNRANASLQLWSDDAPENTITLPVLRELIFYDQTMIDHFDQMLTAIKAPQLVSLGLHWDLSELTPRAWDTEMADACILPWIYEYPALTKLMLGYSHRTQTASQYMDVALHLLSNLPDGIHELELINFFDDHILSSMSPKPVGNLGHGGNAGTPFCTCPFTTSLRLVRHSQEILDMPHFVLDDDGLEVIDVKPESIRGLLSSRNIKGSRQNGVILGDLSILPPFQELSLSGFGDVLAEDDVAYLKHFEQDGDFKLLLDEPKQNYGGSFVGRKPVWFEDMMDP